MEEISIAKDYQYMNGSLMSHPKPFGRYNSVSWILNMLVNIYYMMRTVDINITCTLGYFRTSLSKQFTVVAARPTYG